VHQLGTDLDPVFKVDGANERLKGVREDRGLVPASAGFLTAPEEDVLAYTDGARHVRERPHVDDRGAQLGELSLGKIWMPTVQRVGDHQTKNGVTQEFQPLIRRQVAVLVRVRTVGQRPHQQTPVDRDTKP
jgi:hypothetical protein